MKYNVVLFGAGGAGREALQHMRKHGHEPVAFSDNDATRWDTMFDGVRIVSPGEAMLYPYVTFVVTIYRSYAREARNQLRAMGVTVGSLGDYAPVCSGLPTSDETNRLRSLLTEQESLAELLDQLVFRRNLDYDAQRLPSDIKDIYFPDFIAPRTDEVFVDCGACDGDTVREFVKRRSDRYRRIIAFEPDVENYHKMLSSCRQYAECEFHKSAVSSYTGHTPFNSNGSMSSSINVGVKNMIPCTTIDDIENVDPTYIKMDVEGSELAAIVGARAVIKAYQPVLAVCAYHRSFHLWEIPFMLNRMVPDYELRLRRYAEGARELVWYAVPKNRIVCGS